MKEEEEKKYSIEEIQEVSLALGQGIDSCRSLTEVSAFLQEFPSLGRYDQPLAIAVATIFLVGMICAGNEIIRRKEEQAMEMKGTFICPN